MSAVAAFVRGALDGRSWESPSRNALVAWVVFYSAYFLWIFLRYPFMPILVAANVFLHEAGHPIFGVFGRTAMFWGGTIFQLAFPVVALGHFLRRREMQGAAFSLFWLGANLVHVGCYMADARAGELPLIGGGEHDWEFIFGQLGLLEQDVRLGTATRVLGWLTMLAAPAWMARYLVVNRASGASGAAPAQRPAEGNRWGSL